MGIQLKAAVFRLEGHFMKLTTSFISDFIDKLYTLYEIYPYGDHNIEHIQKKKIISTSFSFKEVIATVNLCT